MPCCTNIISFAHSCYQTRANKKRERECVCVRNVDRHQMTCVSLFFFLDVPIGALLFLLDGVDHSRRYIVAKILISRALLRHDHPRRCGHCIYTINPHRQKAHTRCHLKAPLYFAWISVLIRSVSMVRLLKVKAHVGKCEIGWLGGERFMPRKHL